ncbi:hypothetical protein A8A57_21815 [Lelliottia amnigena]|nr:hypothetical protein A8A57_21815 [Lelliottia amnigena]
MLQRSGRFLLTSGGWVITISAHCRPSWRNRKYLDRENTCEPFGEFLPDSLNGRGDCLILSASW